MTCAHLSQAIISLFGEETSWFSGSTWQRTREAGAWLLYSAFSTPANARKAAEAGAIQPLLMALSSGAPGTREAAAWAVWELAACDRSCATALLDGGAAEALKDIEASSAPEGKNPNPMALEAACGARKALGRLRFPKMLMTPVKGGRPGDANRPSFSPSPGPSGHLEALRLGRAVNTTSGGSPLVRGMFSHRGGYEVIRGGGRRGREDRPKKESWSHS